MLEKPNMLRQSPNRSIIQDNQENKKTELVLVNALYK